MNRTALEVWSTAFVLWAACTSAAPPPPVTAEAPLPAPVGAASASAESPGAAESAAAPAASASSAKLKDRAESAGRPLTIYPSPTLPVTVGRDGAVLRTTNGAELRILADSLVEPRNVLVVIDRRVRGTDGRLGEVYDLPVQIPGQQAKSGTPNARLSYASSGAPFILKLPLPSGVKTANLAIERIGTDASTKKISATWSVVPVSKVESSSTGDKAVFELRALPGTHVHLTSLPAEGASQ